MSRSKALDKTARLRSSGESVQSIGRAFRLLEYLADTGSEASLADLSRTSGLAAGTIHRLLRTLVSMGYVRQHPQSRRYMLGPQMIRLGETAGRAVGIWARPHLLRLVQVTGETANVAMLDGDAVVYVAQVPSQYSVRMSAEVGRRVHPHCTAVGKALLAQLEPEQARALAERTVRPRRR